jgi:DNA-binding transcriptional ArsR family regulator
MRDEPSTGAGEQANDDELIVLAPELQSQTFTMMYDAMLLDPSLSPLAKVTYQLLMLHGRGGQGCWPGMERLRRTAGVSLPTIRAALGELRARGLIRARRRGQGRTNTYTLFAPWAPDPSPSSRPKESCSLDRKNPDVKKVEEVEVERTLFPTVTESAKSERRDDSAKDYRALFGAFCTALGRQPQGKVERARWGKGVKALVGEATVEQVEQACAEYRRRHPDLPCNPQAVAGQMSDLLTPRSMVRSAQAYDVRYPARERAAIEAAQYHEVAAAIRAADERRLRGDTGLGRVRGTDALALAAGDDRAGGRGGVVADRSAVEPRRLLAGG